MLFLVNVCFLLQGMENGVLGAAVEVGVDVEVGVVVVVGAGVFMGLTAPAGALAGAPTTVGTLVLAGVLQLYMGPGAGAKLCMRCLECFRR